MLETTLRTLDALTTSLGRATSIRGFSRQAAQRYSTLTYPQVHRGLHTLHEEDLVDFETAGRSKLPFLNLAAYAAPDALAELELWKKRRFRDARQDVIPRLRRLDDAFADDSSVTSLSLVDPLRNWRLRRLDVLVLVADQGQGAAGDAGAVEALADKMGILQRELALRIDPLLLPSAQLSRLMRGREANPVPRMIRSQVCMTNGQAFWRSVGRGMPRARVTLAPETPPRLSSLGDDRIRADLARYGYTERGLPPEVRDGFLRPEVVAIAGLASVEVRWTGAAALVLMQADLDPSLLAYLAKAEDVGGRLLSLIRALRPHDPPGTLNAATRLLEAWHVEPEPIEVRIIDEMLELYRGR